MAYEPYYKYYEDKGLNFDRGLLTSYCLSLRTKPFVILSGISGTGKTKIAQFFNYPALIASEKIKSSVHEYKESREFNSEQKGNWIIMTVTEGLISGDGRANFKYSNLDALLNPDEVALIQSKIDYLKKSGSHENICDPFEFCIETEEGEEIKAQAYLQRASNPLLRVRFKSKRGESQYDSTTYFAKKYKIGTVLKLEKIGEKRLRIASVNDKVIVATNQELEKEERNLVKNSCFISVRSDWTDSTPLIGHYNFVDQKYHLTPTLKFILTAIENPDIPFFLILDEMNLAKVEHYFSDFLSCLESRYIEEGKLKPEPIHIHSDSGWLNTNSEYFDLVGPTIELPHNLYITGTVNIDESTYMFSSKVLDRANVIELNEVDIASYGSLVSKTKNSKFVLREFPNLGTLELAGSNDFQNLARETTEILIAIHQILEKYHLHFGYRVINEISRFLVNAEKYCEPYFGLITEAIDRQLIQKVLPKLNGPQSKLDLPLRELLTVLKDDKPGNPMDWEEIYSLTPESTSYPLTVAKLKRMATELAINGFVNFIE